MVDLFIKLDFLEVNKKKKNAIWHQKYSVVIYKYKTMCVYICTHSSTHIMQNNVCVLIYFSVGNSEDLIC